MHADRQRITPAARERPVGGDEGGGDGRREKAAEIGLNHERFVH